MFSFSVYGRGAPRESTAVRPFHEAPPVQALSENGFALLSGTPACEGARFWVAGFVLNSPETPEVNHVFAVQRALGGAHPTRKFKSFFCLF